MSQTQPLLTPNQQQQLEQIANLTDIHAQRAQALLAVHHGDTQAAAAAQSGLTAGQVGYMVRKFREQGLNAFPGSLTAAQPAAAPAAPVLAETAVADAPTSEPAAAADPRVQALVTELDELLDQLKETMPTTGTSPYSPLHFLKLLRENVSQFTPDVQLGILENFRDMTVEDMKDIETWKGMAYMLSYSARFQADQMRERMNAQLPHPLKPDTVLGAMKQNVDRFTPAFLKEMVQDMQITREDVLDPDTWKGLWHLMTYSLQFQANQMKERLVGAEDAETDNA